MPHTSQPHSRLAEVIGSLTLATDLATGQPLEHGLRRALLTAWLGEELGVDAQTLRDVYYVALLGSVGCTLEAATLSPYFRDEIALGEELHNVDPTRMLEVAAFFLGRVGAGDPPLRRARKVLAMASRGATHTAMVCRDASLQVGDMLELGPAVQKALSERHEQWNGKGSPRGLVGDQISLAARLYTLSHDVEIVNRLDGVDAAVQFVQRRSGRLYDPRLVALFRAVAARLLRRLESESTWEALLAAEPEPVRRLQPDALDDSLETIADFVDSRSSYTLGHSRAVAELSEQTAHRLGLSREEASAVRWAGLLHDLGRAGVPVAVWEKDRPLSDAEWERVKQHPSLTELILARSDALRHLGALAGLHHERLDGSGFRNLTESFLPAAARVLAAADAYQTKLEPRPHRQALTSEQAAAGSTATSSPRSWTQPATTTFWREGASGPPGSANGRWRCSGCWCEACPTAGSPKSCSCPPRRSATTSNGSTRRSASPRVSARPCSPSSTISSTIPPERAGSREELPPDWGDRPYIGRPWSRRLWASAVEERAPLTLAEVGTWSLAISAG